MASPQHWTVPLARSAQGTELPETERASWRPVTWTGIGESLLVPLPRIRLPQHHTVPSSRLAHTLPSSMFERLRTATDVAPVRPDTATGSEENVPVPVVPSPSSPKNPL